MIYSNPFDVLKEAGFTPENFYIHPAYHSPAGYVPVWHLTEGKWRAERRARNRVTDKNEHRVDGVLR